jgi:hypothetical protein
MTTQNPHHEYKAATDYDEIFSDYESDSDITLDKNPFNNLYF